MISNCFPLPPTNTPCVDFSLILVRVTNAVTKHHDKRNLKGKGLFGFCIQITVHHLRKLGQELKQGRGLEAEADAEALEGYCLLACSAFFLVELRTRSHSMLSPPPSVIKLRKCSTCLPTAQSQGGIFHSRFLPLR